jgi:hypothetical protein
MMEIQRIRLTDLEINRGQVEGLPSNPREWTRTDLDHLITSIKETPELLEARGLIVYPHEGKYIILGGNMRFSALREMNEVDAPCYVMPEDTPIEKLREIIIKDNGAFGSWDYDMLANEWDDLPLSDWGVPAWKMDDVDMSAVDALFEEAGPGKEKGITITISVPKSYEDKLTDIEEAIDITLEEWPGCEIK